MSFLSATSNGKALLDPASTALIKSVDGRPACA
jgi:hypothetical protein